MSSAQLRHQIEHALAARIPGALSLRPRTLLQRCPLGISSIDLLLEGGIPLGAITELVGKSCSGRTSLALALAAQLTQAGNAVAWIDAGNALDPESAAAAGVDLARQLWVRCGAQLGSSSTSHGQGESPDAPGLFCGPSRMASPSGGGGSPHPRNEVRGMPEAISAFLERDRWCTSENSGTPEASYPAPVTRDGENPAEARRRRKQVGTPGMPNRSLQPGTQPGTQPSTRSGLGFRMGRMLDREEQAPTDRQPSRRGKHFHHAPRQPATTMPCCAETPTMRAEARRASVTPVPMLNRAALAGSANASANGSGSKQQAAEKERLPPHSKTWTALDQALRAADLLLNAGGFSALVLDLSSTPAEFSWRIPLATWFRFRAAAERSRTSILLLTQHPCARSSAELVMHLEATDIATAGNLLTRVNYEVTVSRQRFTAVHESSVPAYAASMRKPPRGERRATWSRAVAWSPFDLTSASPKQSFAEEPSAAKLTKAAASWTVFTSHREIENNTPLPSVLRSA